MTTLAGIGASQMSDREFERVASVALDAAGLAIPATKKSLVQSRVARRMRSLGHPTFTDYLDYLDANPGERRELVSALTTNVSSFYRERHHFEFLVHTVLPELRARLERGGRARFWSAGCSSGQEPYTLGMELLRHLPNAAEKNILILGTDIDPAILARARAGRYSEAEIASVAAPDRARFFAAQPDGTFAAGPALRSLVRFRELNLHKDWPMKGPFDAIFCRNVVIYFDEARQRDLWPRFRALLAPGGWLMLGHSERIHPLSGSGFVTAGVTTYRKA